MWGRYNSEGKFKWHLKIKPEASLRSNLQEGSAIGRFDARLQIGGRGDKYINPFTSAVGRGDVGRHIVLENPWAKLRQPMPSEIYQNNPTRGLNYGR